MSVQGSTDVKQSLLSSFLPTIIMSLCHKTGIICSPNFKIFSFSFHLELTIGSFETTIESKILHFNNACQSIFVCYQKNVTPFSFEKNNNNKFGMLYNSSV